MLTGQSSALPLGQCIFSKLLMTFNETVNNREGRKVHTRGRMGF